MEYRVQNPDVIQFVVDRLGEGKSYRATARAVKKHFGHPFSHQQVKKIKVRYFDNSHEALKEYCDKQGIPTNKVRNYWHKSKHFSIHVKVDGPTIEELKETIIYDMQQHSPKYPKIKREKIKDPHLLVVDPADIHIGKLASSFETGEEYDNQIAVQRVREGVTGVINKAQGYPLDKILFVGGNDILHIDTPKRMTTSGTPQDTCGMRYDNFLIAKDLYVEVLEMLMSVADVHFVFNPSNHDYMNGFFLADVVKTWFKDCPHITFDCSMAHRKYYQYGKNLIGTTHGDGARQNDLPLLMATESPVMRAETKYRYIYGHHVHHKTSKDYQGVTYESLRSPSGTDSWHHRNGYTHAPKAIEGFLHHPEYGQVGRFTHNF